MLESSVQQTSEKRLEVVGLIQVDVVPVIAALKIVMTSVLTRCHGISKEEVVKPLCSQREPTRPDEHILGLGIGAAPATASPTELCLVKGPLELHEVGMDLSLAESVVGDGVWVAADPAGRGDGGGEGLTAGRHSDGD
jgi:hypothetical protein